MNPEMNGAAGKFHIKWAANMATSLNTPPTLGYVPARRCLYVHPTCNGCSIVINTNQLLTRYPKCGLRTGVDEPYRPTEDIGFAVARFCQRGATFQSYYMGLLDSLSVVWLPKELLKAIKLCEDAMVASDPTINSLNSNLEAGAYKTGSGLCCAFLANVDSHSDATVNFNGNSYHLPACILPDCKNVVLNTAKSLKTKAYSSDALPSDWSYVIEPVAISKSNAFSKAGLLEQINTAADVSDHLWRDTSVATWCWACFLGSTDSRDDELSLHDLKTTLHGSSVDHAYRVFTNGKLAGSGAGSNGNRKVSLDIPITLVPGKKKIDLFSLTVGLQNYGSFFDLEGTGTTGPVQLKGANGTTIDLSSRQGTYQIGLKCEDLGLSTGSPSQWISTCILPRKQPLAAFDPPAGCSQLALDLIGMGKGEAWVNGQSTGRFWPTYIAPSSGCICSCDHRGSFNANKCSKNCGQPSKTMYPVPRSWLQPSRNTIVLFEESGGNPTQISIASREIASVRITGTTGRRGLQTQTRRKSGPALSLECCCANQICKLRYPSRYMWKLQPLKMQKCLSSCSCSEGLHWFKELQPQCLSGYIRRPTFGPNEMGTYVKVLTTKD
ncbi:LOW QUALITY PROTEIN: Beta-galactosidase, beta-sandwich domain, partial [Dillenia turbinata]